MLDHQQFRSNKPALSSFPNVPIRPSRYEAMPIPLNVTSGSDFYFSYLLYALSARSFVDMGCRTLDQTKSASLVTPGKFNSNIVDTLVYIIPARFALDLVESHNCDQLIRYHALFIQ